MSLHYDVIIPPKLQKMIETLDHKFMPLFTRHMTTAMNKTVTAVVSSVKPLTPIGVSGRLRGSIGGEVVSASVGNIVGRVGSSLGDEVYPAVMNFGRTPGATPPPAPALMRWIHLKHITGTYSVKTHKRMGSKKTQAQEDEAIAFVIARAIGRHGIKGRHFFEKGWDKVKSRVPGFFKKEVDSLVLDIEGEAKKQ